MQYTEIKNPAWGNEEKTSINCLVSFGNQNTNFEPFTSIPEGDYPHTHEIYARCLSGEFGEIGEYEPPPKGLELTLTDTTAIHRQPVSQGTQTL